MFQSLAQGKEDIHSIRDAFLQLDEHQPIIERERTEFIPKEGFSAAGLSIEVDQMSNINYQLSTCCNPKPGDAIFAFISVTKGIRIHRCDCPNAENMRQRYRYRILPAHWAKK